MDIIVWDRRPERIKRQDYAQKEHFRGRYWQEINHRFKSRFTKNQIRKIWEGRN
jgi:hypothetical protein